MKIGIIIQARMSSQRLPGKVLKPIFQEFTILDIIIRRLKRLKRPIVIATGDSPSNKALANSAYQNDVSFFVGGENNVLKRFIDCAEKFEFEKILRVCADNPFLDYQLAEEIIYTSTLANYDYVSHFVNDKPAILTHYGFFSEVVSCSALLKAYNQTHKLADLEHVTPYIYQNKKEFSIKLLSAPLEIARNENIRLTVDTEADFNIAAALMERLINHKGDFAYTFKDVLAALAHSDDSVKQRMMQQISINSKS